MKEFLKKIKLNEANIGLGLGIAVLILSGLLLVSYFRSINRVDNGSKTLSTSTDKPAITSEDKSGTITSKPEKSAPKAGSEYQIQKGDSLWKISLKAYGTGYSWNKIYEANKELIGKNPSVLSAGVELVLPASEVATTEYTVVRGDNLWNISVKMCGTGFAWEGIAAVNNLPNPRIIQPGIVLKVQCK